MNDNSNAQNSFDFGRYMKNLLHYWWVFVLCFILCFGGAFFFLRIKAPKTLVVASILIDDQNPLASLAGVSSKSGSNSMMKSLMGGGNSNVYNEMMILQSETLGAQVIKELGINCSYFEKTGFMKKEEHYKDSPIEISAPQEVFDTLSISMKFQIKTYADGTADITVKKGFFSKYAELKHVSLPNTVRTPYGIYSVQPTRYFIPKHEYNITAVVAGYSVRAQDLMKDMTVDLFAKKTDGIYLDVTETNVERGKAILNTLIKDYNERDVKKQEDQGMHTAQFIDDRLALIYKDLMGSEAEIESYQKAHNVIDAELQVKAALGNQNVSEKAVMALETQIKILGMVKDFLSNPANSRDLIPFDGDSTGATGAIRAYNNLITRRMHLEGSARDNNQVLKELDNQISITRQNVTRGVDNALRSLQIKLAKANSELNSVNGDMSNAPSEMRDMRSLYRDQAIQNEIYIFLLQKREENALKVAATKAKGEVVDAAYAQSEPVSPKKPLVFFAAFILALGLPIGFIYLKKLMNNKFTLREDLEGVSDAPVIGTLLHNSKKGKLEATDGKSSTLAENFRFVRNNLQFMLPDDDDKVILVTSGVRNEGKTFTAVNLASSFASLGKKVALIDLNIRNPKAGQMLNINETTGITNYLSRGGELSLAAIAQPCDVVENLDVYVAGEIPPNPAELLQCKRMSELFDELRANYDFIVIDSAPVEVVSDTMSLTKWADAIVYVTRAEMTKTGNVKHLNRLIADGKLKNVGVVLNDVKGANKKDTFAKRKFNFKKA